MASSIAEAATRCLDAYRHVQNLAADQPALLYKVTDQLQNIHSWMKNMNVHGESHLSLDYRVGDAEEIRELFIQLLDAIAVTGIDDVKKAEPDSGSGSLTARRSSDDVEVHSITESRSSSSSSDISVSLQEEFGLRNQDMDEQKMTQDFRLDAYVKQNDSFIKHLQRLSNAVRAASGQARAKRVNDWWSQVISSAGTSAFQTHGDRTTGPTDIMNDVATFETYAKTLIAGRFSDSELWLRERIVASMVYRRIRCHYLASKRPQLRLGSERRDPATDQKSMISTPSVSAMAQDLEHRPTVQFEKLEGLSVSRRTVEHPPSDVSKVDRRQFRKPPTTIVSRNTAFSSAKDEMLSIPPCPVKWPSTSDFTCPHCNFILPASDAQPERWRRHVIQDLEPYICIRENCPCAETLYSTSEDWLQHLYATHDIRWRCSSNDHGEMHFNDDAEYQQHILSDHDMVVDQQTISLLSHTNQIESPEAFVQCPLCGLGDVVPSLERENTKQLVLADIISHLRELALFSLVADDIETRSEHLSESENVSSSAQGSRSKESETFPGQSTAGDETGSVEHLSADCFFDAPSSQVLFTSVDFPDLGEPPQVFLRPVSQIPQVELAASSDAEYKSSDTPERTDAQRVTSDKWLPEVVVGIEIGTAQTVIAWSLPAFNWPDEPHLLQEWPGCDMQNSCPTRIAYDEAGHVCDWGFCRAARVPMRIERGFIPFLDPTVGAVDDRLEPTHSEAVQCYIDFASELFKFQDEYFRKKVPGWSDRAKEYHFSVPDLYNDPRLSVLMREWLAMAAFTDSKYSKITIELTTSEADLLHTGYCMNELRRNALFSELTLPNGEIGLALHAGAQTSVIAQTVSGFSIRNRGTVLVALTMVGQPTTIPVGSVHIDDMAMKYVQGLLEGKAITVDYPLSYLVEDMMETNGFEHFKCNFDGADSYPDFCMAVPDKPGEECVIKAAQLRSWFDVVISALFDAIDKQLLRLQGRLSSRSLVSIMLSGGLGSSKAVLKGLQERLDRPGVVRARVTAAPPSSSATAFGLVRHRMHALLHAAQIYFAGRMCRASYGVLCVRPYDKELHIGQPVKRDEVTKKLWVEDQIDWLTTKGEPIPAHGVSRRYTVDVDRLAESAKLVVHLVMSHASVPKLPRDLRSPEAFRICTVSSTLTSWSSTWKRHRRSFWRKASGRQQGAIDLHLKIFISSVSLQFEVSDDLKNEFETSVAWNPIEPRPQY